MNRRYPLISVIIVNWNGEEVLDVCLKSLSRLRYPNWELVFVDNGSVDQSLALLGKFEKKLKAQKIVLIKNKINHGFAKANNQGFNKSSGEFILLLNNDTRVTPNFLNILIQRIQENLDIGVVQPKILVLDNPKILDNCGSFLTSTGFLEHWGFLKKDSYEYGEERLVFSVKGACMLIRREAIVKTSLFDDDFVSYFEETDFCWRIWIAGWKVMYVPTSKIYHKIGFSSKKQNQIDVNYHSIKNRLASITKNLDNKNLLVIGGMHVLLLIGLGFYYLVKFQLKKSWMIWRGFLWNLINIRKTMKKRKVVQRIRNVSDRELFKYILKDTSWTGMFEHFKKVEANFK